MSIRLPYGRGSVTALTRNSHSERRASSKRAADSNADDDVHCILEGFHEPNVVEKTPLVFTRCPRDLGGGRTEVTVLLDLFDEAFDKKSWHGPNLRGSIRGVTARQAAWRPAPGRHNIWELTLHAAYWKYVARRRLTAGKTGEKRGSFVLPGSNFFGRPMETSDAAWKTDINILAAEHRKLREVVAKLATPSRAQAHIIRGVAAHDLYHAGQVRLLRRLCPL